MKDDKDDKTKWVSAKRLRELLDGLPDDTQVWMPEFMIIFGVEDGKEGGTV